MWGLSGMAGLLLAAALSAPAGAAPRGVSSVDLVKAAKAASVSRIDDRKQACDDGRNVERWLKDTVGTTASSIAWSGGTCKLANKQNPRDVGTRWCAQAAISPKKGGPPATVEIYFDEPKAGRPGNAFAFRASVRTKDGWDTMRETNAFETNWGETYVRGYQPPDDECNKRKDKQ